MGDSAKVSSVGIPLFQGFTALDIIGPYESLWQLEGVQVYLVGAEEGQQYTSDSQMIHLTATKSYRTLPNPDVILVPGGLIVYETSLAYKWGEGQWKPIIEWVQKAHQTSKYTTSVCTGALILAAAGLLKGANATTHWIAREEIQRPEYGATYVPQRIVWVDEENSKVSTCAGVSSGIDFGLTLCAKFAGDRKARACQLTMEYDPQPPFDCIIPGKIQLAMQAVEDSLAGLETSP